MQTNQKTIIAPIAEILGLVPGAEVSLSRDTPMNPPTPSGAKSFPQGTSGVIVSLSEDKQDALVMLPDSLHRRLPVAALTPKRYLPPGTQVEVLERGFGYDPNGDAPLVVLMRGDVGTVKGVLTEPIYHWYPGTYHLVMANGTEVGVESRHLGVHRGMAKQEMGRALQKSHTVYVEEAQRHMLLTSVVGSTAFGLANENSDQDVRAVYQYDADTYRGLWEPPTSLEDRKDGKDEEWWELRHYLTMALKANPSVLETLFSPYVTTMNELGDTLIANRKRLLSKRVYATYNGYAISQFKKLEQDFRTKGEPKWKHAMHLIRLLVSGAHLFRTGELMVDVGEYREDLLRVRNGEMSWQEVDEWRIGLNTVMENAYKATTCVPDEPDFAWVNEFLVKARRSLE